MDLGFTFLKKTLVKQKLCRLPRTFDARSWVYVRARHSVLLIGIHRLLATHISDDRCTCFHFSISCVYHLADREQIGIGSADRHRSEKVCMGIVTPRSRRGIACDTKTVNVPSDAQRFYLTSNTIENPRVVNLTRHGIPFQVNRSALEQRYMHRGYKSVRLDAVRGYNQKLLSTETRGETIKETCEGESRGDGIRKREPATPLHTPTMVTDASMGLSWESRVFGGADERDRCCPNVCGWR